MKSSRISLVLFLVSAVWKLVRTDWIVVCPWWTDPSIGSAGTPTGFHDATFYPPVSPAWKPPNPMTSGIMDFGSGASFSIGTPWVRPCWELIGLKVGFPLMVICSFHILRFLIGKNGLVTNLTREIIAESKRQKSWNAADDESTS